MTDNPYLPPESQRTEEENGVDLPFADPDVEPLSCPIASGVGWVIESIKLVWMNKWRWIASMLILWVVMIILTFIVFAIMGFGIFSSAHDDFASLMRSSQSMGWFITPAMVFVYTFMNAGFMRSLRNARASGKFDFSDIFSGFSAFRSLAVIVVIFSAILLLAQVITQPLMEPLYENMGSSRSDMFAYQAQIWKIQLISISFYIPYIMLKFFVEPLVVINGVLPFKAIKKSFRGSLKNILPLIVLAVSLFVASILFFIGFIVLMMIPILGILAGLAFFFLGIPLLGAVFIGTFYVAYEDVFGMGKQDQYKRLATM